ncbi:MAG: mannose-1-phosphate guanylyltransferase/mannose-6-phosphate isomerase [Burkholderiaceae bacterium]
MKKALIPVILSGGSGSRLWPLSRAMRPKQFLGVTEERSLFQNTLIRLTGLMPKVSPIVVANTEHRFLVADQCLQMGITPHTLILEPLARNTAPAIAAAALQALAFRPTKAASAQVEDAGLVADGESDLDPVLLVLPSDHVITDTESFHQAVREGYACAQAGALVTFGIVPTHAETGYGYVKAGDPSPATGGTASTPITPSTAGTSARPVSAFIEKPNRETAERYLRDGGYYWNSGMFLFRADVYLKELQQHNPAMAVACEAAHAQATKDMDFLRLNAEAFAQSPSDSIDYAVMEKTNKAMVIPLNAGWNDVGAWPAVWQLQPQDQDGNATRGDALLHDTRNCYVHADHRLVALVGTQDLVVVETSDAVLVAHKDKAQDVKKIVEALKAKGRPEADLHREVFRPWGAYDSIDHGDRYQVKRISVKPGARLSLQMHHHRAEHWIVVSGTAKVTIGEKEQLVAENQSVYIPIGEKHCLENPGKLPLELIEVQSGSYLGEDDIVRFEDRYGRA